MTELRETVREMIWKTDRTLILVSAIVWASLTVYSALLIADASVAGGGVAFIVYMLALLIWGKLLKDWMDERRQLLNRLLDASRTDASDEIRRLREAIEKLRESLES
ncbi:hypothetical protein [Pyrodictium abyssi]|uniref:Uncharacterized protein n=1 Tax=Pyrodictium abyssi TaxID=54256 RepID=A0ABN6ZPP9_9CREN|nr:hypothetical protein PABY_17790 [Pyrodictium abyssi]